MVERAIILSGDAARIAPEHITLRNEDAAPYSHQAARKGLHLDFEQEPTLEDLERRYLGVLLEKFAGHRGKVARTLGISERNVYRLLRKYEFSEF